MRKSYLFYKLAMVALTVSILGSCSKDNGINNVTVIATPYSLYFCDSNGSLWNTNDGVYFKTSVFPADGVPSRAIMTADSNLIWVKGSAHVSTNDGVNFNPTYTSVNPDAVDQTMIIYARDEKRVYIAAADGIGGIKYNDHYGAPLFWRNESTDTLPSTIAGFSATSFTELKNNTLIAFDWHTNRLWYKFGLQGKWQENAAATALPGGGQFTIGHYNNTVVAVDRSPIGNGAWYSNDLGLNWYKYSGLPTGRPLYAASGAFDQVLLVGSDSDGVYALQSGYTFALSSGGLTESTIVRAISPKENIYVNGVSVKYIYIATNKGIFRSQDLGQNWILVRPGNYFDIY